MVLSRHSVGFFTLIVCFICITPTLIFGQKNENTKTGFLDKELTFYSLDTQNGLSNNIVKTIGEDALGFLWIGTSDGLNRYDGNAFEIFRKENSGLSNNYIQDISFAPDERIILATDGGINFYDSKTERFDLLNNYYPGLKLSVNSSVVLDHNRYAIGIYNQGLFVYNGTEEVAYKGASNSPVKELSSLKISCIAKQNDSIIWVGTFDKGLNRYNIKTDIVTQIPLTVQNTTIKEINTVYVDDKANAWIGTENGLFVQKADGKFLHLDKSAHSSGLSGNRIMAITKDDLGNLWVGTYNDGLNVFNIKSFLDQSQAFSVVKFRPNDNNSSITNASINTLKKDRNGYIWIGTNAGLNFVDPAGEPVRLLKSDLTGGEKLKHNRINDLILSNKGVIYLATDGGGIDTYNPQSGALHHDVYTTQNGLKTNYLNTLAEDDNSNLWVGTYQKGLHKLDLKSNQWSFYLQGAKEDGNDVRCLFVDHAQQLWVGTNRGGLFKYNKQKDTFEYIDQLDVISPKMDIRAIDEDQYGTLWMATYGNGILKYNPDSGEVASFFNGNLPGITSNVGFSIKVLDDGTILTGLKHGGLIRFKEGDSSAKNYTEFDGLSNNTVNSIIDYDGAYLILGTDKGISKFDLKDETVKSLNFFNNIQVSEYNEGAAIKSSDGTLYFGGNKGVTIFNPEKLERKNIKGSLIIKDFRVANEEVLVDPTDSKAILDQSIIYKEEIKLAHNQTNFSLAFTDLSFPFATTTNYSYLLDGYNEHWIDLKNTNRINFSNIPHGNYVLKIKAENQAESPKYTELAITIAPPFWETWPAYLFYIVTLFILIWAGLKYYAERVKLKNSLIFEQRQRQLEQEINEERIRFYTGFSHELKTPLTLILAPLESLLENAVHKQQRKNLKLIKRNANNLLQFINKLLEFRKSEEGLSNLDLKEYNITKNISNWLDAYQPLLKTKNIDLILSKPQFPISVFCDLEKIQVIINNLVSNAIKYSPEHSKIYIKVDTVDNYLQIRVKDSGAGIDQKDIEQIFEWYYQSNMSLKKDGSGIGLALSKRFAELHQGSLEVISEKGKGSCFTLKIPYDDQLLDAYLDNDQNAVSNKKTIENQLLENVSTYKEQTPVNNLLVKPDNNRKLLLLIDDNPDILEFLDGVLSQEYDLIHAENGEIGINQAIKYIPDLIISDIMMPIKSGIDLCQFLKGKKETSHIPIILLSAKNNCETIETGYTEGADDYMIKPFNVNVLKARITNLIHGRKLLLQNFSKNSEVSQLNTEEENKLLDIEKQFLLEFKEIVLQNMQEDGKLVTTVAQEIGMSRSSLYRKIKALTGKNINNYIRTIKIEHAAYLIEKQNFGIAQAAYEVGFSDPKYFRKIFKQRFGKTPSDFKPN